MRFSRIILLRFFCCVVCVHLSVASKSASLRVSFFVLIRRAHLFVLRALIGRWLAPATFFVGISIRCAHLFVLRALIGR